ncbi:ABC transporter ATP-binding protein [Clostridium neuense]|uniref:ABC transporter ATP-binding protein n=1 Tax=Clostridium neuense TaxID=1728934 RepID=A0ABW8TF06_9CLOT
MAGLIVKNLSKTFEFQNKKIQVLKDINLDIPDRSFITMVGKSGCGKTTFLRIVAGLESKTEGQIEFINCKDRSKKKIGIVFQEPRLMPWLTVEQNLAFSLIKCKDKSYVKDKVQATLEILGLADFKKAYPSQISGGMAQRVSLGRTLCFDPKIILMDEPLGALDAFTRKKLQNELVDIFIKSGKTFIFVTHDIEEAVYLGQRVAVMNNGIITEEIQIDLDFYRNPEDAKFLEYKKSILNIYK